MFRGARWRATHQQTIDTILGPGVRKVRSQGAFFYNRDGWTARAFMNAMCEWARLNPGWDPKRHDVENWIHVANATRVWDPSITIAATPDDLPKGTALALTGGGYHEAWHTEMSRRTPIRMGEVWPKIQKIWRSLPVNPKTGTRGWDKLVGMLLTWGNIIDDVRIERRGCEKYAGALRSMEALQDLILKQEAESREEAAAASGHRGISGPQNAMSVVIGTFRDLGLGYQTAAQATALEGYREANEAGYKFVAEGPLRPLLDRAIALPAAPDLGGMWLAFEVVLIIAATAAAPPPPPPPQKGQKEGQKGTPQASSSSAGEPQEGGGSSNKPTVYKVGDRATLKSGKYKGREVEITHASVPDPNTGEQALQFALVEDD